MSGNHIQDHLQPKLMRTIQQFFHHVIGSIPLCNLTMITDVISTIHEKRFIARIHPDTITSKFFYVFQPCTNSFQISDSIRIGILKTRRIYFIKNCTFQPFLLHILYLIKIIVKTKSCRKISRTYFIVIVPGKSYSSSAYAARIRS